MEQVTPINLKLMPILLMVIVSVIMIVQYPTALAGACVDEDGDHYWANDACRPNLDPDDNDPCNPDPSASTCGNTVIESDVSGSVDVGPNETVVITNGATIDGNLEVNGGTLIIEEGVTINGNIESTGGTVVIEDGSTLNGNVQIKVSGAGGVLEIKNASISGNIESVGIDTLTIINIILGGNISSTNDQHVTVTDNDVNGNVEISGTNNYCTESSNVVNGNNSGCP